MTDVQYALSWSDHLRAISNGLSSLQQNEEFVDMTLAADGHYVKVHKVVMALASPYIKEIIGSVKCDHPVIFLNKVSFNTLISILEYVYTGEVYIQANNIEEFIGAANDLHIKGLKDLSILNNKTNVTPKTIPTDFMKSEDNCYSAQNIEAETTTLDVDVRTKPIEQSMDTSDIEEQHTEESQPNFYTGDPTFDSSVHYTMSNRGSLQMILNKFMYYLKHTNKDCSRQWRCVDYLNTIRCPALVFTKDDIVVQRVAVHNHKGHETKIRKRLNSGNVFAAIREAEAKRAQLKAEKEDDSTIEIE